MGIRFPLRRGRGGQAEGRMELYLDSLRDFAEDMQTIQDKLDFHMSARGWCYALEPYGLKKGDFKWAQDRINDIRRQGFLKPGFILEEEGHEVEEIYQDIASPEEYVENKYNEWQEAEEGFETCDFEYGKNEVSFWDDQKYYIQLLVEKVDLKSLFRGICQKYQIPIANLKGWGSLEQKATMAANFKRMEESGHIPVLFECGDFDPAGITIAHALPTTFRKYSNFTGWDSSNLIVRRIGLSYKFIQKNNLTWIDGLGTGSGKDLANPDHICNKRNTYSIKEYVEKYGERKCEANAVVVVPDLGKQILQKAIDKYVGEDAYEKYREKIRQKKVEVKLLIEKRIESMEGDSP